MMSNASIRHATIADSPLLSQLTNSLSHFYLAENTSELPTWLAESFNNTQFLLRLRDSDYLHFVAELDNKIVGFIAVKLPNHLYHLFVDEHYHGQGIGKQLWQYAFNRLQLDEQNDISVRASLYAVPFYQKLGFVVTDNIAEKDGLQFLAMQRNHRNQK